jgi:hypothetical protein
MLIAFAYDGYSQVVEKAPATTPMLELILAKDHIEGSFLTPETVYADRKHVFLASYQGKLFILDRTKSDYPIVATIQVSAFPLRSVRGDQQNVYVTSNDGKLYAYQNREPFTMVAEMAYSRYGLLSLVVEKKTLLISLGQATMTADSNTLFISELNPGDTAREIDQKTLIPKKIWGDQFELASTVAFDRSTGERIGAIPNPKDILGRDGQVELNLGNGILIQMTPGCCGTGVFLYDAETLEILSAIHLLFADSARIAGNRLVVGTEAGTITVFDITDVHNPVQIASADLRALTGHLNLDDIELRSLWVEERTGLIFAATSWGNQFTRSPTLPTFFVLQMK